MTSKRLLGVNFAIHILTLVVALSPWVFDFLPKDANSIINEYVWLWYVSIWLCFYACFTNMVHIVIRTIKNKPDTLALFHLCTWGLPSIITVVASANRIEQTLEIVNFLLFNYPIYFGIFTTIIAAYRLFKLPKANA